MTIMFSNVFCQIKDSNEIVSEGGAKVKVKPDVAIIKLTVEKRDTDEKNAVNLVNLEMDTLVKCLYSVGFTDKIIRISDYDISGYQNDLEEKWYTATNSLNIEFGLDRKLIDALYRKIEQAGLKDLEISFETKVSDSVEKATRTKLTQYAIEDAKQNATNIASALNAKLVKVKNVIKYREGYFGTPPPPLYTQQIRFTPPVINEINIITTSFDKFQLEEIELEEKITIVYQISQ